MKPRTAAQLPTLRAELVRRRDEARAQLLALTADLSAVTSSQFEEGTVANHPADEATDLTTAETLATMMPELKARIAGLEAALARIEAGSYGVCVDCGEDIDPARLKTLPAARCLRCQTRLEWRTGR